MSFEYTAHRNDVDKSREELVEDIKRLRSSYEKLKETVKSVRGRDDTNLLASIVEHSDDAIIGKSMDGIITSWNRGAEALYGYSADEAIGRPINMLAPPDHSDEIPGILEKIRRGEHVEHYETVRLRKDGKKIDVSLTVSPIFDASRNIVGASTIARSITERRRAEEVVRLAGAYNRSLIESSLDPLVTISREGVITDVNRATEAVTGYPRDRLINTDFSEYFTEPDKAKEGYMTAFKHGSVRDYALEIRHKDGHITPVIYNASVYRDEYGNVVGVFAAARDMTERKRAEAELLRVNRAMKAISKCNEAMIHISDEYALLDEICKIIVDIGGYRMAWIGYAENDQNKTVRTMSKTGYEEGYIENARITWSDTERGRGPTGTAIRTGKYYVVRNIRVDPGFKIWREEAIKRGYLSAVGLPLNAGGQVFGALTIYSEKSDAFDRDEILLLQELADNLAYGIMSIRSRIRKEQAENALIEAKAQAELYLDLMGHDISNMHQIALGYLELARDMPADSDHARFLDTAIEVLQRSTLLIQNVRKLQKLKDGVFKTQVVNVCEVLENVQREFAAVPNKTIILNLNRCEHCYVHANELLHDVFSNLVSNAIKHTGDHTEIVVDLDVVTDNSIKYCRILVEDNGPGIPDDFKGKLFNRMLRGTTKAKGMGLGLYLVKSLVESYGGGVWVEDRVAGDHTKGARFVVFLPAIDDSNAN